MQIFLDKNRTTPKFYVPKYRTTPKFRTSKYRTTPKFKAAKKLFRVVVEVIRDGGDAVIGVGGLKKNTRRFVIFFVR